MAETEETNETPQEDKTLRKYNVDLGENRGTTIMKLNAKDAEKRGLSDADLVEGEEAPVTESKAKAPANKKRPAANK